MPLPTFPLTPVGRNSPVLMTVCPRQTAVAGFTSFLTWLAVLHFSIMLDSGRLLLQPPPSNLLFHLRPPHLPWSPPCYVWHSAPSTPRKPISQLAYNLNGAYVRHCLLPVNTDIYFWQQSFLGKYFPSRVPEALRRMKRAGFFESPDRFFPNSSAKICCTGRRLNCLQWL